MRDSSQTLRGSLTALALCIAAAACSANRGSGLNGAPLLPDAIGRTSSIERVLYAFAGRTDGASPESALLAVKGELYGTTVLGGDGGCKAVHGCGTVYRVDGSGQEKVLHVFTGGNDGEAPEAPLTDAGGDFFGTTVYGGGTGCKSQHTLGCGTIFQITPAGVERVLYRFPGKSQGAMPVSRLTPFKHELYGEAGGGGSGKCYYADYPGCGLIFKMSRSGHVAIVYTFKGDKDAGTPMGGLLWYKGAFYGASSAGGSYRCYFSYGCGTVFKISPSGVETILHRFTGSAKDGALPTGLVVRNGALYGTTFSGGNTNCGLTYYFACGTVFEVTLSGRERIIYNFTGQQDGGHPNQLVSVGGKLYGTTSGGLYGYRCGTVFELTPSGQVTTLYQFKGGADGCGPNSQQIQVGGTLYGVTGGGGGENDGAVYALTP